MAAHRRLTNVRTSRAQRLRDVAGSGMLRGLMGTIIGIDLGTTNSCVAIIEGAGTSRVQAKVIPNAEGARTTPSVVAFASSGERLVGHVAKRQAITNPENTVYAIKRLMGRKFRDREVQRQIELAPYRVVESSNGDAWVQTRDRELSPPEISAMILGKMREVAQSFLGLEVVEAVVTVPAYLTMRSVRRRRMRGRSRGLTSSVSSTSRLRRRWLTGWTKREEEAVAVYDLGEGRLTFRFCEIADPKSGCVQGVGDPGRYASWR